MAFPNGTTSFDPSRLGDVARVAGASAGIILQEIADSFRTNATLRITKLRTMIAESDTAGVVREAHALEGACAVVGATAAAFACGTLSTSPSVATLEALAQELSLAHVEIRRFVDAVASKGSR